MSDISEIINQGLEYSNYEMIKPKPKPKPKVIEYKIFHTSKVNDGLESGWVLYGNPFQLEAYSYQAMVKYGQGSENEGNRKSKRSDQIL